MKRKTRILLASMATIAMSASVAVGGTYALFTSESKVNISVTSGTVAVRASIQDLTLYSYGTNGAVSAFTNGGTAVYDETTNTLTLDKITPGDKVAFNIVVKNESNVAALYRTVSKVSSDNGLYSGLVVTMQSDSGSSISGAALNWTDWETVAPEGDGAETVETVAVTVELPYLSESQNQYQDKSCSLSFTVEAVQGNATVENTSLNLGNGFEVEQSANGEIVLTEISEVPADGVVEIPVGVTSVGEVFAYNNEVTKVVLPETVTVIDVGAFSGCDSLEEVVLPDTVTEIGMGAFAMCESLTTVEIPESVTSIGQSAFAYSTALESVTIPESVTSLGAGAFTECTALETVVIEGQIDSIGMSTFRNCTSLTSVELPDSVTSIGQSAFANCSALETIAIPEQVTTIEQGTFQKCSSLETVEIKGDVTSVGGQAFMDCSALTEITLPETVETIGIQTFQNCTSLTTVELSDDLTKVGQSAFQGCTSLTQVDLPESLTTLDRGAFQNTGLTSVEIPSSLKTMSNYAFYECANLTEFILPDDSTAKLSDYVVTGTQVTNIVVPAGVTLSEHTFRNMYTLESVTFKGNVSAIPDYCFAASNATHLTLIFEQNTQLPTFKRNATISQNGTNVFFGRSEVTVIMPKYVFASGETSVEVKVGYDWTSSDGTYYDRWTTLTIKNA